MQIDYSVSEKDSYILDGKCLQTCIVYKAVITNKGSHIYYDTSDVEFI